MTGGKYLWSGVSAVKTVVAFVVKVNDGGELFSKICGFLGSVAILCRLGAGLSSKHKGGHKGRHSSSGKLP